MTHLLRMILWISIVCFSAWAQDTLSVTLTATFNNIGADVLLTSAAPQGAVFDVFISRPGSAAPAVKGHPLSRIANTRFAGSIFNLSAGTAYSIQIVSSSPAHSWTKQITTRSDAFPRPSGTVYHVAPGGSDTRDGLSLQNAFASLAKAVATAQAGATILLHEGRYCEEVTLPRSGTAVQPIVIRNAPGEHAVLDGRDTAFRPAWTAHDAARHIYKSPCATQPRLAFHNGKHLFRYDDAASLAANAYGIDGAFCGDGSYLYVLLPGGRAPGAGDTIIVPRFTTAISSDQSNIQIIGLEIRYYGRDDFSRAMYFNNASGNLVDSCYLHHNNVGVSLKRASNFNTVQHCTFDESPLDAWTWQAVKETGSGYYEAGGVVVYGSDIANTGNVVRHNRFGHLFDGGHIYSDVAPTTDFDFHDNIVEFVNDDGLETDGSGTNCRIYNNHFHSFLTGVSIAPAAIGPTYIMRNLLTAWHANSGYDGYPFKFNVSSSLSIDWVFLYHNTCFTNAPSQDGFLFKQYSAWNNIISRNNIYAGTAYALDSWSTTNPVDFDYDDLYTVSAGNRIDWANIRYATVASFCAATSQECHGRSIWPQFMDTAAGDFRLQATSPVIDSGIRIAGVNDLFAGAAPDMGAFESGLASAYRPAQRPAGGGGSARMLRLVALGPSARLPARAGTGKESPAAYDLSGRAVRLCGTEKGVYFIAVRAEAKR